MKTPEEWFTIQSPHLAHQRKQFGLEFHQAQIDLIAAIQLDAWKQGMTDAAEIASECEPSGELNIYQTIQERMNDPQHQPE